MVLFVVFEDNSVVGDIDRAKGEFFKTQEAIRAEYDWYLRQLRKAQSSSDGGTKEIDELREQGHGRSYEHEVSCAVLENWVDA